MESTYNVVILEKVDGAVRKVRSYKKRIIGPWVSFYQTPQPTYGKCLAQKGKAGLYANTAGKPGAIIIQLHPA